MPTRDPVKMSAYNKRYRERNYTKLLEKDRIYSATHKEEKRAKNKIYYATHKEKWKPYKEQRATSGYSQDYYAKNRETILSRHAEYVRRSPHAQRAGTARYQARKRGAVRSDLTARQWKEIKAVYGYKCVYCGARPKRLTQDHITPLSKGGAHTVTNVVPACGSCNSRKRDKAPLVPVQPLLFTVAS